MQESVIYTILRVTNYGHYIMNIKRPHVLYFVTLTLLVSTNYKRIHVIKECCLCDDGFMHYCLFKAKFVCKSANTCITVHNQICDSITMYMIKTQNLVKHCVSCIFVQFVDPLLKRTPYLFKRELTSNFKIKTEFKLLS